MINYSIPKPHALCGHFVKINTPEEYDTMKQIAEGCGFDKFGSYQHRRFFFMPNMEVNWSIIDVDFGQEITLSELRELAELSKLTFPCDMSVSHNNDIWHLRSVVGFYNGYAITYDMSLNIDAYKYFRLPNPDQYLPDDYVDVGDEVDEQQELIKWQKNAEEDFLTTPISVLKYIHKLETALGINSETT